MEENKPLSLIVSYDEWLKSLPLDTNASSPLHNFVWSIYETKVTTQIYSCLEAGVITREEYKRLKEMSESDDPEAFELAIELCNQLITKYYDQMDNVSKRMGEDGFI